MNLEKLNLNTQFDNMNTRTKMALLHIAAMCGWAALHFAFYIPDLPKYGARDWADTIFSIGSLIALFYSSTFAILWVCNRIAKRSPGMDAATLGNNFKIGPALLTMAFLLIVYVTVAVLMDEYVFQYKYKVLRYHIDQRLSRGKESSIAAVLFSYILSGQIAKNKMAKINAQRFRQMQLSNANLKELHLKFEKINLFN